MAPDMVTGMVMVTERVMSDKFLNLENCFGNHEIKIDVLWILRLQLLLFI
jgi:hypothetical protein